MFTVSSIIFQLDAIGCKPPRAEEMEQYVPTHQQEQCDCHGHSSVLLCESTFQKGRLRARERTEWIDEVPVDGRELRFRMPRVHHLQDSRFLLLLRINQEQRATGLEIVVELASFLFSLAIRSSHLPRRRTTWRRRLLRSNDVGDVRTEGREHFSSAAPIQSCAKPMALAYQPWRTGPEFRGNYRPVCAAASSSRILGYDVQEKSWTPFSSHLNTRALSNAIGFGAGLIGAALLKCSRPSVRTSPTSCTSQQSPPPRCSAPGKVA